MGPDYSLDFHFVDRQSDKYDYRVVLSAEGSSAWDFAHGNIVVMNTEAKVLFTVTRANRWTSKGAHSGHTGEKGGLVMIQRESQPLVLEGCWWARKDLNLGPMDYESTALTAELRARRTVV